MELLKEYIIPWSVSNIIAILFVVAAYKKPKLARLLFVLLFSWACWINYTTVHSNPSVYLDYANFTPFDLYASFINGWFKEHIIEMVTFISIGQGLIALGMLLKGWVVYLACIGAVIFFLAIAPFGIGSGFPASLLWSVAIYFILKNDDLNYLWKFKNKEITQT